MKLKSTFFILLISFVCAQDSYEEVQDKSTLSIQTPSLQKRETAKIRLKNGLEAYIISDPETDKSAAALSVSVGSWSDPDDYPGMAHFLEHMVFMGTKKYPEEEEFMGYVRENYGLVNAYTASDHTVYMFSINNEVFPSGLDRFSHFFIDPLFKQSGVGRELHAVDQEHSKNIENDGWRQWMIIKETGNQSHPNAGFSTGNAETLGHIPREALLKWYKQHYSANQMHLVVYSHLPLEQLKTLVVEDFSSVPNWNANSLPQYQEMTSDKQRGSMIYIEPVKDIRQVNLLWELPKSFSLDNETKAAELISYVLSNGGEKSLLHVLKKEGLAEDIVTDVHHFGPENALFFLDIELTERGVEMVNHVISRCFQALNLLKKSGIPPYIFNEMETMAKLDYEYQSRQNAFSLVQSASDQLVYEDLDTFPDKTLTATTYFPQKIQELIDYLNPENAIYFLIAPSTLTGVTTDRREKWNGGEYAIKKVGSEYLIAWDRAKSPGDIALPTPNPFIPSHLALVNSDKVAHKDAPPIQIANNNYGKIYFWQDTRYHVPDSASLFQFKSPLIDGSPRSTALLALYLRSLDESLHSILSDASRGGLNFSASMGPLSCNLVIGGYSEKAPELLTMVASQMRQVEPTEAEFTIFKESQLRGFENNQKNLPYYQAKEVMAHTLFSDTPTSAQLAVATNNITYSEFVSFSRKLFETAYVEGMLAGNLTEETARSMWQSLKEHVAFIEYPKKDHYEQQVLVLPSEGPFMISEETEMLGNAAILALEEGAFTLEKKVGQLILSKAIGQDFFATLRTKQQTGYIAQGWTDEVEKQLFQFFGVQSATHNPQDLLSRFELFLEDYTKDFRTAFPKDRFENIRDMTIASLEQPPTNLAEMVARLSKFAFYRDGNFDFIEDIIETLNTYTYEQMEKFAKSSLSRQNGRRLAVLFDGVIPPSSEFRYHRVTSESIQQQGHFVAAEQ